MKFVDLLTAINIKSDDLPEDIKNLAVTKLAHSCAKCWNNGQRVTENIHRHHLGCEHMWLEHFKHKARTKLYRAFKARYDSFNEKDIVRLCEEHHRLIHIVYLQQIQRMVAEGGYRKLSTWSWEEARGMMKQLRKVGELWIAGKL